MSERGVKNKAGGSWTTARYFSFIRSALRAAWMKYPVKGIVLKKARRNVRKNENRDKRIRHRFEFKCAVCKKFHKASQVQVDHIIPCGSLNSYEDLPRFVSTLFCEEDNLQVICTECHNEKTKKERVERAEVHT